MVQELSSKPNMFGRFGQGLAQGLAESIPKEIEHQRLRSGLKSLSDKSKSEDLSPEEYLSEAAGTYGVTPQMIASFGELAKNRRVRNNFKNSTRDRPSSPKRNKENTELPVNFFNLPDQAQRGPGGELPNQMVPLESREEFKRRQDPHQEEKEETPDQYIANPLSKGLEEKRRWTEDERNDNIEYHMDIDPSLTWKEARQLSLEDEARDLSEPIAERKIREDRIAARTALHNEFDTQLKTTLEKQGNEIYKDLSGDEIINLKKSAEKDLLSNPNLNEFTAAAKWVKKGKDLAETKQLVNKTANRDAADWVLPHKKEEHLKRLMSAQKIFAETGNLKDFYHKLQAKTSNGGLDLSPGASAMIAYPRSEGIKKLIKDNQNWKNWRTEEFGFKVPDAKNMKFAEEIADNLTGKDSILAIAREAKQKNPDFNENLFFDYFRNNQDDLGLNPQQKKELVEGVSDFFRNWGDWALFPLWGRSKAND